MFPENERQEFQNQFQYLKPSVPGIGTLSASLWNTRFQLSALTVPPIGTKQRTQNTMLDTVQDTTQNTVQDIVQDTVQDNYPKVP